MADFDYFSESCQGRNLSFQDVRLCILDPEPSCSVDLRKLNLTSGSRWPFHAAEIAGNRCRIAIALKSPGCHDLAASLLDRSHFHEWPGANEPSPFSELSNCCFEGLFLFVIFPFGNGPCSEIFFSPVRIAGMNEQNLETPLSGAVHDQSSTLFWHACRTRISPQR
jgi:hypothetical protein